MLGKAQIESRACGSRRFTYRGRIYVATVPANTSTTTPRGHGGVTSLGARFSKCINYTWNCPLEIAHTPLLLTHPRGARLIPSINQAPLYRRDTMSRDLSGIEPCDKMASTVSTQRDDEVAE